MLSSYADKLNTRSYSAAQELVSNIIKHSNAAKAEISFLYNDGRICLRIEDDGVGLKENERRTGIGLVTNKRGTRAEICIPE